MTTSATGVRRAPGRPRSAAADEAILDAAIELFADAGYEGLTVEGVAARAGVGKATVYRRYPGKLDLVVAACRACTDAGAPPPDTGTTRGDLRMIVDEVIGLLTTTPLGRAMPMLLADRARVPELEVEQRAIVRDKRGRIATVVERAIAKGDLCVGIDPELVVDGCVAPIFYRHLVTGAPLDDAYAEKLVDSIIRAFGL